MPPELTPIIIQWGPVALILFGILSLPGVAVAKLGAKLKGRAPEA